METIDTQAKEEMWNKWDKEHKRGKRIGGVVIVIVGILFLAKELGAVFPAWLFTWKMLLIAIGLVIGIKHGFRNPKWLIPVAVGGAFLASDLFPELALRTFLWPLMIIALGLFIIFKPHRRRHMSWKRWQKHERYRNHCENQWHSQTESNNEDSIDFTSFMGGIKKNILSKNFKRGDITVIFAGTELNFSQADFNEKAELDITTVFGGTLLIVPANWEIKSEVVCAFGSVEDKRIIQPITGTENRKVLTLRGTVFMGGIEIKNY